MPITSTTTGFKLAALDDLRTSKPASKYAPAQNTFRREQTDYDDTSQGYYHDWDVRHLVEWRP